MSPQTKGPQPRLRPFRKPWIRTSRLFLAAKQNEQEPAADGSQSSRGRFRNNGNAVKSRSQLARSANVTDQTKRARGKVDAVELGLPTNCSREKGIVGYGRDVKPDAVGETDRSLERRVGKESRSRGSPYL